jgi:hypothetical protein
MIDVLIVLDNSPSMASKLHTLLSIVVAYGEVLFPHAESRPARSTSAPSPPTSSSQQRQPPCDQLGAHQPRRRR